MIPSRELIALFSQALHEQWGYIFGKYGQTWTRKAQRAMEQTVSSKYAAARKYGSKWIGHRVTDCSGLFRWALLQCGVRLPHSSHAIWTDHCSRQGKLTDGKRADGFALRPGTAVFLTNQPGRRHHIGLYAGDGLCIEAKGTRWGVVSSGIAHWDEWGEMKEIDYSECADRKERDPMDPTLRKGDRGEDVKRLQNLLNQTEHKLAVDGVFGSGTEQAVKAFQKARSLTADGVAGPKTWAALEAAGKQQTAAQAVSEGVVLPPATIRELELLLGSALSILRGLPSSSEKEENA